MFKRFVVRASQLFGAGALLVGLAVGLSGEMASPSGFSNQQQSQVNGV